MQNEIGFGLHGHSSAPVLTLCLLRVLWWKFCDLNGAISPGVAIKPGVATGPARHVHSVSSSSRYGVGAEKIKREECADNAWSVPAPEGQRIWARTGGLASKYPKKQAALD